MICLVISVGSRATTNALDIDQMTHEQARHRRAGVGVRFEVRPILGNSFEQRNHEQCAVGIVNIHDKPREQAQQDPLGDGSCRRECDSSTTGRAPRRRLSAHGTRKD